MKLQPSSTGGQKIFTAHGAGFVTVNGERYSHPIVVMPQQVLPDWQPQGFDSLDESHFAYFLELKPEIVLLGTGSQQRFPHPRLYRQLIAAHIGIEFMNTPAACRTYNILVAESRKVAAAVLL